MKRLILYIFLLTACHLQAQDPYYKHLDKSTGLPSNDIYDIFQDSKGYIWLAGGSGLVRYDGFEYKVYTSPKQSSKPGTNIKEDIYGRIWYINFDNLLYYVEKDSLHAFPQTLNAIINDYALIENHLLFITGTKMQIWDIQTLKKIKEVQLPQGTEFGMSLKQIGSKFYFYGAETGLWIADKAESFTFAQVMKPFIDSQSEVGVIALHNSLYILPKFNYGQGQLCKIDAENKLETFSFSPIYAHSFCTTDTNIWMCTPKGVYLSNEKAEIQHQGNAFFPKYSITSVIKDREGNHWFSTSNEGILVVPNFDTHIYQFPDFKPLRIAYMDKSLYVGTKYDEIFRFSPQTQNLALLHKSPEHHEIYMLYSDTFKQELICTSDKFKTLGTQGHLQKSITGAVKDISRINVYTFAVAFSGGIGLLKDNLLQPDTPFCKTFTMPASPFSYFIEGCRGKSIAYIPPLKTLYYATNIGLYKVDSQHVIEITDKGERLYFSSLKTYQNEVYALDTKGILWKIDEKGILQKNLLPDMNIDRIKIMSHYLFLYSAKQLNYIDLQKNKFLPQKLALEIPADEINDLLLLGEKLYLAADIGLLQTDWQALNQPTTVPLLRIHTILLQGKTFPLDTKIEVPYTQNEVEIKYAILSFRASTDKSVYYRINQGEWQPLSPQSRSLKLVGLSPDDYEIDIKLGDNIQKVQFTIRPPFGKRNGFSQP